MSEQCEDCGKRDATVAERACVYVEEIHGVIELEVVCDECESNHADDI